MHSEVVFSLSPNNNVGLQFFFEFFLSQILLSNFHISNLWFQKVLIQDHKQIAESFRRFGIAPTTTNLLIIKVSTSSTFTGPQIQEHLYKVIDGTQVPFSDDELRGMTDLARVRKVYKLNGGIGGAKKGTNMVNGTSENDERKELEILVLGNMALRGATN